MAAAPPVTDSGIAGERRRFALPPRRPPDSDSLSQQRKIALAARALKEKFAARVRTELELFIRLADPPLLRAKLMQQLDQNARLLARTITRERVSAGREDDGGAGGSGVGVGVGAGSSGDDEGVAAAASAAGGGGDYGEPPDGTVAAAAAAFGGGSAISPHDAAAALTKQQRKRWRRKQREEQRQLLLSAGCAGLGVGIVEEGGDDGREEYAGEMADNWVDSDDGSDENTPGLRERFGGGGVGGGGGVQTDAAVVRKGALRALLRHMIAEDATDDCGGSGVESAGGGGGGGVAGLALLATQEGVGGRGRVVRGRGGEEEEEEEEEEGDEEEVSSETSSTFSVPSVQDNLSDVSQELFGDSVEPWCAEAGFMTAEAARRLLAGGMEASAPSAVGGGGAGDGGGSAGTAGVGGGDCDEAVSAEVAAEIDRLASQLHLGRQVTHRLKNRLGVHS
jgi:hypothetical protein